ncbi:MAG: c-type cytochrome [Candidatus Eisenbacteria bacterium]|uniref:C-type cytochrome n=1 Tax=Eiseniibacteriota bacterium TaxID=2212470 RepID=A0A956NGV8_UNCEI|nr:c-type cytochrome [Candidatus Eisenbacteria bacterium]
MSDYQADRLLDHDYDGIQEYDNRLPNWWLYTLYGAIVFSVAYWIVFHTLKVVPLPRGRYELEMAAAAEAQLKKMEGQELTDETLALMATVPARVEAGHQIFNQFCVVCHADKGQGNVGPNLTDNYWLHGSRPLDILNTVTHGVPEKGMAAWGGQLGPRRVQDVVSFVLTIKNTNVPGKAPQGDLVVPGEEAPGDTPAAPGETPTETPAGAPAEGEGASPVGEPPTDTGSLGADVGTGPADTE